MHIYSGNFIEKLSSNSYVFGVAGLRIQGKNPKIQDVGFNMAETRSHFSDVQTYLDLLY